VIVKVDIKTAREKLMNGEVVAIPTETVYGLGGWIRSEAGLLQIFATKERPFFDPLIVHIDGIASAKKLTTQWTVAHEALAQACWPGPLTLIAKKGKDVNPLITSGLDSVGLRCPRHTLTLELLASIEGGIAAPSANKFGKTSPTTADHVEEEFAGGVPILEGGSCEVGIESTVAGIKRVNDLFLVEIYRPGFFTAQYLDEILQKNNIKAEVKYAQSPVAPGQLTHHYMPTIPLVIVPQNFEWSMHHQSVEEKIGKIFNRPIQWKQSDDPRVASRELYEKMRSFDKQGYDIIYTSKETHHFSEEWLGIWNRLEKAKTLNL
jgi:L-threonylcarbamoyladenylate synthase